MAAVFKLKSNRNGKRSESKKFYIQFKDHRDIYRRVPGEVSRKASESLMRNLDLLAQYRRQAMPPGEELGPWLKALTPKMRRRLAKWGMLDKRAHDAADSIEAIFERWEASMAAERTSNKQIRLVQGRALKVLREAGYATLAAGLDAEEIKLAVARLCGRQSDQTRNFHLAAVKQFSKWATSAYLPADPLVHLKGSKNPVQARPRRVLTPVECMTLLEVTATQPERWGMAGAERALLYRMALETGMRANELRTLTRGSLDLGERPTVTVESKFSKNSETDELPLRPDTAELLRRHTRANKLLPGARVFNMTKSQHSAKMLRGDLEAAGIDFIVNGKRVDFHALRHTFVTNLVSKGVDPRKTQRLARHSSFDLTLKRYNHSAGEDLFEAVSRLPDLPKTPPQTA